jgi:quercetin dioxygenase-like cupin family protein
MPFIDLAAIPPLVLAPGVRLRTPFGVNLMLSYVELDAGAVVPVHHHPHEQGGYVISGRVEFTIGEEKRVCGPGDLYLIPPHMPHTVTALERCVVLDIFTPIREDYAARVNTYV